MKSDHIPLALLASAAAVLVWSGIAPSGRFNWFMETAPAIIGGAIFVATYQRFRFTTISYCVVWLFALILMIGGHYTYAQVPLGNWARDAFGLTRNHFDRFGHFFQGVVPALLARELLRRKTPLPRGTLLNTLCVCVALAISAAYELFEWRYAVTFGGQRAEDFLGSQGDPWDAQRDMFQALLGGLAAMIVLASWQEGQAVRAGFVERG